MILGNTIEQCIIALIASLITTSILFFARALILNRLPWIKENVNLIKDYPLMEVSSKTHSFFLVIVGLYIGSLFINFPEEHAFWPARIMLAAFALQGGLWANELVLYFIRTSKALDVGQDALTSGSLTVINFVSRTVLWSIVFIFFLSNLGFDVTALLTGLGVGGVAVALAVQNILGDLFASLSIVIDKPFKIGDFIIVDEFKGYVENVGLKTTRVRSLSGEQVVFANADLLSSRIRNYKRMERRRITFTIDVTMDTTPDQLEQMPYLFSNIIDPMDRVTFGRAHFKEITDRGYSFEIVYFIENPDMGFYLDTQHRINLEILRCLDKEEIELANSLMTFYGKKGLAQYNAALLRTT